MQTEKNRKMKLPFVHLMGFICLTILMSSLLVAASPVKQTVDIGTCAECHEDTCADFKLARHAGLETQLVAEEAETQLSCAKCHGDPTQHLEAGGGTDTIFSFKESGIAQTKAQKCLSCHAGTRARFFASPHGKAAMDCTNCHDDLMKKASIRKRPSDICVTCHSDVDAKFQMNERHRLQEGILECTTCHDQHAPDSRERLGGFKHQACMQCHTDKGGPFLYEHGASRIEGCQACHEVHGSPNRHLLVQQSVSDLCFSCHMTAVSWHARFNSQTTNCTVCHSTIHGSNLDKRFLK